MRAIFIILCVWCQAAFALAAESELVDTGQVNAQLVSSHDQVAPGQTFHVALRTVLDPHWHTYWLNPGDSGEPVQIDWTVPETLTPGDIVWPLPDTIPTGPIVNYGFEGVPYFPVEFIVSPDAQIGEVLLIEAGAYYLVCEEVCIPENADLSIQVTVGAPQVDDHWQGLITDALGSAPKGGAIKGGVVNDGAEAVFTFNGLPQGTNFDGAYFFPFEQGVLDHSAPQTLIKGESGLQIRVPLSYGWDEGKVPSADGVLRFEQGGEPVGTQVFVASGQSMPIGALASTGGAGGTPSATALGLWGAIIGAFLGGLVLNLMPCVFPIISIKALAIAGKAHGDSAAVRRDGWIYTAGVLTTFFALTVLLLILKAAGAGIGWGFQLQSPVVVSLLALLLFAIGLNLLGLFEIGTGLQNTGGSLVEKQGWQGTFYTGALAVIVATPCTAPFMAGAIGYALAQPAIIALLVFMSLAAGFAAPFLLLSYMPGLLRRLPKPGPWMTRFRELLAFPMLAAAIWLVWVLAEQSGSSGPLVVLSSMLLIALAIWAFKSSGRVSKGIGYAAVIGALMLPATLAAPDKEDAITLQDWSPQRVEQLRGEGQAVFVDFTAAWCVTCKVNEKLVLNRPAVRQMFADTNTAFLVADWTNKNAEIADELARHGRSGVPLYLLYTPGNNPVSPEILPQILTADMLGEKLKAAQSSPGS